MLLKIASVFPLSAFGSKPPFFPGLNAPTEAVVSYFSTHAHAVLICAFLQLGAASRPKSGYESHGRGIGGLWLFPRGGSSGGLRSDEEFPSQHNKDRCHPRPEGQQQTRVSDYSTKDVRDDADDQRFARLAIEEFGPFPAENK